MSVEISADESLALVVVVDASAVLELGALAELPPKTDEVIEETWYVKLEPRTVVDGSDTVGVRLVPRVGTVMMDSLEKVEFGNGAVP